MIEDELTRSVAAWYPGATGVAGTLKLSGGASQETWSFEIMTPPAMSTPSCVARRRDMVQRPRARPDSMPRRR